MENVSNIKKRLTIVAWIMGALIVALSGTLIGVLAASSQGLGANFSISYDIGQNVAMKFRYKVNGNVQGIYLEDPSLAPTQYAPCDENGFITFDTGMQNVAPYFDNNDIVDALQLSPENPSVTIEFDFINLSSSPLYVGWQDGVIVNGDINVEMYLNGGRDFLGGPTKIDPTSIVHETVDSAGVEGSSLFSIKFVVSVSDVNSDMRFAEFICAMVVTSGQ